MSFRVSDLVAQGIIQGNSAYATIFYDSANTGYYVDPASNSNIYQLTVNGDHQSGYGIVRVTSSNDALLSLYTGNNATAGLRLQNSSSLDLIFVGKKSGSTDFVVDFGFTQSGEEFIVDSSGNTFSRTSSRAPIFYDSDNTAYYLDPNAFSNLSFMQINSGTAMTAGWNRTLLLSATYPVLVFNSSGTKYSGIGVDHSVADSGFIFWVNGSSSDISGTGAIAMRINTGNYVTATGSFRAPIFYDSQDTNYYVDPNSTSKLVQINLGTTNTRLIADTATGYVKIYGSASNYLAIGPYNNNGWAYQENLGNSNGTYYYVQSGRHAFDGGDVTSYGDGSRSLGNTSYRWNNVYITGWFRNYNSYGLYNETHGNHFYATSNADWNFAGNSGSSIAVAFRTGGYQGSARGYVYADSGNNIGFLTSGASWGFRMDSSGNTFATSSSRAPIFYDSDNTSYYGDFAGTSNFNGLNVGGSPVLTTGNWTSTIGPNPLGYYGATPYTWTGSQILYYWTKIANISNVGDSQFTIEISGKNDVNYVPYVLAIASISAWNNSTQSLKLDTISSYDRTVKIAIDNSGDVWLYGQFEWSSYLRWRVIEKYGSPTIYTGSFTQQTTQPANSVVIEPGQQVRGNQGSMSSAGVGLNQNRVGSLDSIGDIYAPRIYDRDNTSYYLDPAGTSVLNGLTIGGSTAATQSWVSSNYMLATGIPSGSDQYVNFRVIRNSSAGSSAGMHIGYGNQNGGNTMLYGGGSTSSTLTVYSNSIDVSTGGDSINITGAQGRVTFRDQALAWTGYVGFRSNTGILEFPGRNVTITGGYNSTIELNNGTSGYNDGVVSIPWGRLIVSNNYIYTGSYVEAAVSMRAPIFYDSNDTNYYLDPTGLSNLTRIQTKQNWYDNSATDWGGGLNVQGTNASIGWQPSSQSWWYMMHSASNNMNFYRRSTSGSWNQDGIWYADGSLSWTNAIRATIFYDYNDTSYYLDPAADLSFRTSGYVGSYRNDTQGIIQTHNTSAAGSPVQLNLRHSYGDVIMQNYRGWIYLYANAVQTDNSFRAPIFYDSQNTSYYLDPNSTTSIRTVGSWRSDSSAWDGEFSGKIQYHANHWYIQGADLFIYRNAGGSNVFTVTQGGNGTFSGSVQTGGQIYINNGDPTIFLQDSNHRSSMIHCNSNRFYILRGSGTNSTGWSTYNSYWPLEIHLEDNNATFGGTVSAPVGDFRAPIFYDSNDTTYYLDPNSLSNLRNITVNHTYGSSILENGHGLVINGNYTNGQYSHRFRKWDDGGGVPLYMQFTSGTANSWSNLVRFGPWSSDASYFRVFGSVLADSTITSSSDMRAPIFYDSNDTTYYADFASTGIAIQARGLIRTWGGNSGSGAGWDAAIEIGETSAGTVNGSFPTYITGYGVNIRKNSDGCFLGLVTYDGGSNYHSVIGWGDDSGEQLQFRFNNGVVASMDYVGNYTANSSLRAPIFYDSNDTTYYADFNNTGRSMYTAGYLQSDRMIMKGSSGGGQIYPTIAYGGMSMYGGDSLTNGAWITVTGISYGSSPGAGSAEIIVRSEASSKIAMYSYNGSTYTGRAALWGSNGNFVIGSATTDYGYKLYVDGTIYATGNVIAYSDESVKTNVREIENPLARVLNTRGVIYDRIDNEDKDNIGFIAQELEKEFPELVSTGNNGKKGVMYQNMVAVLIEAMKEQNKEIQKLKMLINGASR